MIRKLKSGQYRLLGGLGVRDLTRWRDGILVLAGQVNGADGPLKLLQWKPRRTAKKIQTPDRVLDLPSGRDHLRESAGFST